MVSTNSAKRISNARISRGFSYFMFHRVDAEQVSVKTRTIQSLPTFARHLVPSEWDAFFDQKVNHTKVYLKVVQYFPDLWYKN